MDWIMGTVLPTTAPYLESTAIYRLRCLNRPYQCTVCRFLSRWRGKPPLKTAGEYDAYSEIQEMQDFFVLYERSIGTYADLEKNWYQFLDRYQTFMGGKTLLVERFFNDPSVTSPSQCICDLCMTVEQDCGLGNVMRIGGGKFAVYHLNGEIKDIFETLQGIFSIWMPQSGYHMAQRYGLNIYRHIDREEHRGVMDLCIPVS